MTNIPTDLLRTLVAVVDLRSFTRAAQSLGVTQPAVSAQIKRLQCLLGTDVLDKSAPGVTLTPTGEMVVAYARRMLSINDQILHLAAPGAAAEMLRIGIPQDFFDAAVACALTRFRVTWPEVCYRVRSAASDVLMRELRAGELDVALGLNTAGPDLDARHSWSEPLCWVRGPMLKLDLSEPVPLVSFGDESFYYNTAVDVLGQAGYQSTLVFSGSGLIGLAAVVSAGMGVAVLSRHRFASSQPTLFEDTTLPELPRVSCSIYVRGSGRRETVEQLADTIAAALRADQHGVNAAAHAEPAERTLSVTGAHQAPAASG